MESSLILLGKAVEKLVMTVVYICDDRYPSLGSSLYHLAHKAIISLRKFAP